MKNRMIAFLTTAMMTLSSAAAIPSVQAADKTVTDPIIEELPDWVPQDFADAMQFYNNHGKTYVSDEFVCLVRPMLQYRESDYSYSIDGSMTLKRTPAEIKTKIYELDIPEKPDPSDKKAVKAYEDYCDKLGLYSHDYSFFESYAGCKTQYAFEVELFRVVQGYNLTVIWSEKKDGDFSVSETFGFTNDDGNTVETDYYSWLPDCPSEYDTYSEENNRILVQDNYVAYRSDVNYSTGATLKTEQSGDGKIEQVLECDCNGFELIPRDGSASHSVILYKPTANGTAEVKWTVGREWSEEQPYLVTEGKFEIFDNCSIIIDRSPGRKMTTVFTLVDADTGEQIDVTDKNKKFILEVYPYEDADKVETLEITSNPYTLGPVDNYDPYFGYSIQMESAAGIYESCSYETTYSDSKHTEETVYMQWTPSGDANGDGSFSTSDLVLMKKWLLGVKGVKFADWNSADLCRDNKLNAADFCMMRKKYIKENILKYVEPEVKVEYGTLFRIIADDLKLYLAPDESSRAVASIPRGERLWEKGYNKGDNDWMFTEYNGQYGWIKTEDENGEPTVNYEVAAAKPVIYLYPEKETDVHVELELTEADLSTTYPKYDNGWDLTAYPDGTLLNKADGTHHRYLFWDADNCRTRFDYSKGFCVAGEDTESFLKEKLTYMGLTEEEMNEFIVYWLPRMEHNTYNLISFQGNTYTDTAKLNITPTPDSICRIFMAYVPLEKPVDVEPQQLDTFERKGFTVVEWGGNEVR